MSTRGAPTSPCLHHRGSRTIREGNVREGSRGPFTFETSFQKVRGCGRRYSRSPVRSPLAGLARPPKVYHSFDEQMWPPLGGTNPRAGSVGTGGRRISRHRRTLCGRVAVGWAGAGPSPTPEGFYTTRGSWVRQIYSHWSGVCRKVLDTMVLYRSS